jgi:hypothetical protein
MNDIQMILPDHSNSIPSNLRDCQELPTPNHLSIPQTATISQNGLGSMTNCGLSLNIPMGRVENLSNQSPHNGPSHFSLFPTTSLPSMYLISIHNTQIYGSGVHQGLKS